MNDDKVLYIMENGTCFYRNGEGGLKMPPSEVVEMTGEEFVRALEETLGRKVRVISSVGELKQHQTGVKNPA